MIGFLTGYVLSKAESSIILSVANVGYEVFLSTRSLENEIREGIDVSLYIHTHVKEDDIRLYGFVSNHEKLFFKSLISVSGIGAKSAMQILSSADLHELSNAIRSKNTAFLQRCPGIGKKSAERITLELSDKIDKIAPASSSSISSLASEPKDELISALLNLGYKRNDCEDIAARIDFSKHETFDKVLRESLKLLGR